MTQLSCGPGYERPGLVYDDPGTGPQAEPGARTGPGAGTRTGPGAPDTATNHRNPSVEDRAGSPLGGFTGPGIPTGPNTGSAQLVIEPAGPEPGPAIQWNSMTKGLVAVAAGCLIIAVVMIGLFVARSSALDTSRQTVTEREAALSTATEELDRVKRDLSSTRADLEKAKSDLTGSQHQATDLARQKQVIGHCMQLISQANAASAKNDAKTEKAKLAEARPFCDEASRYLG